ncbi:MAG: Co2+/Mg2+ efflux protein ApaG [Sphingomonadaceae bacterium]|uniref:Co2+/Mg2+ efflux protein ApaG n=1 Tax=Thermaurantiacus sp. TaxID=2820283 RepID=UPI00298F3BAE|nr:Co2+/Mg2+ efflux protein ApaG [Thermaurantiacus sp.]MCS6986955.1 Co2+/Mg2+ efflux protein ApaG [Sphingomonadaceae bacterium]MDW8415445.1 Co2+/Mg2+ efflux protein ApaG [Thermaurantiacus sp.]
MSPIQALFPYVATTGAITVRVQPTFAPEDSRPTDGVWVWRYHVRIENHGDEPVQLLDRHWIITDAHGRRAEVRGAGVVGEQPLISPGGAHDYVSACPLSTPSGTMEGSYGMVAADGRRFRVAIPAFDLVSPDSRRRAN